MHSSRAGQQARIITVRRALLSSLLTWIPDSVQWDLHCAHHIQGLPSPTCGTITHCHTLIRPGYCPFCLGMTGLSDARCLASWYRDHSLWQRINHHLQELTEFCTCPHSLCDVSLETTKQLWYHSADKHGLSRTMPKETTRKSKTTIIKTIPIRKSCHDLLWLR